MNPLRREKGVRKALKVLKIWDQCNGNCYPNHKTHCEYFQEGASYSRIMIKARKPCSCSSCGNQRRLNGEKTIQEQRQDAAEKDQLKELESDEK
jgi:hypothetical protein